KGWEDVPVLVLPSALSRLRRTPQSEREGRMREQYYIKPKTWTNHEVAALWQSRSDGLTMREIAYRLERSPRSVRAMYARICKRGRPSAPPPIVETMAIPKGSVPQFYVLGWRFMGFSAE